MQPRQILNRLQRILQLKGGVLKLKHYLEQRIMTEAAFGLQIFHNLLKRQILVGKGPGRYRFDSLQRLAKRQIPVKLSSQHQGIHKKANQPLGFRAIAVGDRGSHHEVLLSGVAIEERFESGQQQHEQGDSFLLTQRLHTLGQGAGQNPPFLGPPIGLTNRAGAIARQLQGGQILQLLSPIVELRR